MNGGEVKAVHRYIDAETGKTLDTWFPATNGRQRRGCRAEKLGLIKGDFVDLAIASLDAPPASTEEAYLRLHLLSERAVLPNAMNLEGLFALLPVVAWTSAGPVLPQQLDRLRDLAAAEWHHLTVPSMDRFPRARTRPLVPRSCTKAL